MVQSTTLVKADPKIDLLSGDEFGLPAAASSLAIVPVGEPQPASPVASHQNALVLADIFGSSSNNQPSNSVGQANASPPQIQQQNFQSPQSPLYPNGRASGPTVSQYEQSQGPTFPGNGPMIQQQQPPSPPYGAQTSGTLPPPWEAQLDNSVLANSQPPPQQMQAAQVVVAHSQPMPSGTYLQGPQQVANEQVGSTYFQPMAGGYLSAVNNQAKPSSQMAGLNSQPIMCWQVPGMFPQPMQSGQMAYMYPQQIYGNPMAAAYGYGQQNVEFLEQNMSG